METVICAICANMHKGEPTNQDNMKMITVCKSCLCASCWQGVFYCDDYLHADTTQKTVAELKELAFEHPSYWMTDEEVAFGKGK